MKKYFCILVSLVLTLSVTAQIQRKRVTPIKDSSTSSASAESNTSKKELIKNLDLTPEQKTSFLEIGKQFKSSKSALENDTTLRNEEKKERLKALRKEQFSKILALLTEEQKIKFKEMSRNRQVVD